MFQWIGIDHVQIAAPAGCEEEARRFYGEILRMSELPKPAVLSHRGGVWFQCGHHQLHIGVQEDFHPATKAHPAFEVSDLNRLREQLSRHGITMKEDVPLPGILRVHVNDPFGNRLEFVETRKG